jgi:hypothetical protein
VSYRIINRHGFPRLSSRATSFYPASGPCCVLFCGQSRKVTSITVKMAPRRSLSFKSSSASENRETAKQIYDDDMLRHNPGGGLEDAAMRKVVERSREMLKVERKVELSEIFDLSMAKEAEAELKKAKWEP